MVPLFDIQAQHLALEERLADAFRRVFKSGQFILGPEVTALESEIAAFCGVEHAIGVSSGTDAILLALMALDIGPGDEVLCPAFTFFATAGCVSRVGATPVFVDVDQMTFNMEVRDAERKLSARTKAIIPVHLFGLCAEMTALSAFAAEHKLFVIEDAAQSLGASVKKQRAGSMGDFGAFSFYPTKNLGGLGDGGMLVCKDSKLARKARALRSHGAEEVYHHNYVGGNFRLDALQAAFLRVKFEHYETYTAKRTANAAYYTANLENSSRLILPVTVAEYEHIWNQYTVRIPNSRDAFRTSLKKRGIQTVVLYPVPLNRQECFKDLRQQDTCPNAAELADQVVSLPIYPELAARQLEEVVIAVRETIALSE